jgi:hypothetical protein
VKVEQWERSGVFEVVEHDGEAPYWKLHKGGCVKSPSPRHLMPFAARSRPDKDEVGVTVESGSSGRFRSLLTSTPLPGFGVSSDRFVSISLTIEGAIEILRGAGVKGTGC